MAGKRVLAIASAGGHWVQMRRLCAGLDGLDLTYVSTYPDLAESVAPARFHKITDVHRRNLPRVIATAWQLFRIMLRERPDVVVSTGALPGLIGLAVAKLTTGARTIWIDSIANCEEMSSSGKRARRFADRWLTQWPDLAGPQGPEYWGALL